MKSQDIVLLVAVALFLIIGIGQTAYNQGYKAALGDAAEQKWIFYFNEPYTAGYGQPKQTDNGYTYIDQRVGVLK